MQASFGSAYEYVEAWSVWRKELTSAFPPNNLVWRAVRCPRKLDIRYELGVLVTGQWFHIAMACIKQMLKIAHEARGNRKEGME